MKKRGKIERITMFVLLVLYAVSMAVATFVENRHGTPKVFTWFYHSPWFIALQFLLAVNFIWLVVRTKMFSRRQWGSLLFHSAFVIILAGAGITHFFSYEGIMHIREGDKVNYMMIGMGTDMQIKEVPFEVYLEKFTLKRYPGSHSPSSFESDIILSKDGKEEKHKIYMNNVVDIGSYRLFQTSYDPDERGTVLSVNYDRSGRIVTYIGYVLLMFGMVITLFQKNSRFRQLMSSLKKQPVGVLLLFLAVSALSLLPIDTQAQDKTKNPLQGISSVTKEDAAAFGEMVVQNPKGRLEPVNSWTLKVLRKVAQSEEIYGYNSDQVFLNFMVFPYEWNQAPIIKIKNKDLIHKLGKTGEYIALRDVFDEFGNYKIEDDVEETYRRQPADRSRLENDILKLDEIVNILVQIQEGQLLAFFPDEEDKNGKWYSVGDDLSVFQGRDSMFVSQIMVWYLSELGDGNSGQAEEILEMIRTFQNAKNKVIPVNTKNIKREIKYNKARIFNVIIKFYLIGGAFLLIFACLAIFKRKQWIKRVVWALIACIGLVFFYQTYGIGLRWYIAGHAPWTNTYETTIFLAWIIVLGGLLFSFRFPIVGGLTSLLAGILLFVASLNQQNPEITPLVPVLQSLWLVFHVAIIMVGYGFFFICALMGLFNLSLMSFYSPKRQNALGAIRELTVLNEMSMILGLIFMTAGTFLGAIWANESWGRYWGWDPKETWALISVIVYTIVLHIRFIPGWKSSYLFNLLSVLAVGSILMTYFGVNYYLGGMHSYGKTEGQILPLPVIIGLTVVTVLAVIAYLKNKKRKFLSTDTLA